MHLFLCLFKLLISLFLTLIDQTGNPREYTFSGLAILHVFG